MCYHTSRSVSSSLCVRSYPRFVTTVFTTPQAGAGSLSALLQPQFLCHAAAPVLVSCCSHRCTQTSPKLSARRAVEVSTPLWVNETKVPGRPAGTLSSISPALRPVFASHWPQWDRVIRVGHNLRDHVGLRSRSVSDSKWICQPVGISAVLRGAARSDSRRSLHQTAHQRSPRRSHNIDR